MTVVSYRVADKYLASAPQTPQRADYQLLPLTPMDQPQANANLDFSQHLLGSNTISPAMPILGDQCQVLPRTPNGNSNSGYMRYSLSPSTAVILDLSSPVREPHKGEEKFETNVKEDRADEKKTEKEKKDAMVHLELIAVK
ncbi:hypothetical protein GUITHDRAFT_155780 [Guillardia theta CCMP2712]|uniref:Uncharacterized protein n=1 Tax=Guillardia theta (strain CCMP2712) TaxID=905079 RepID=L1IEL6_GUITC|nr:hypothetical protein GUITHDRAFT_155780 [Guillardia theta CCMP2712]EKX34334.1 hypothetical protein GUITHDRAFT_155780 [Guillardia theta CCMP2712]|eukprot:XP_005821314.1 hypothetical protein GUITHDRAFT_155780 [Guillardia theta CCMP2712]